MKQKLNEDQLEAALDDMYQAIVQHVPDDARIAIIGIRTRGETLAGRIVDRLRMDRPQLTIEHGVVDITFYRDDLSMRRGVPLVRATEIDFDIDDTWLLLVDDVLHTGRSVRAALHALHDFGRPRVVRLAVLIDRGGHELPIAADFVGKKVKAPHGARVQVRLKDTDDCEGVFIVARPAGTG